MRAILVSLIFLFFSPHPLFAVQYRDATEYCQHLFPSSYTMLESCINQETEAAGRVNRRHVDRGIWRYCQRLFPNSWSMIESCIDQEEAAKRRLGPVRR